MDNPPTDQPPSDPLPIHPLALRPKDASKALGIGRRKLWELTSDRTSGIPHVRVGRSVLYPVRKLADWLNERLAEDGKQ
jgi:predicted DNA-binding transcriptional regulator AlpA